MSSRLILAINPGSTSTKFSLFMEDNLVFEKNLRHTSEELKSFGKITDQFQFRKDLIMNELLQRKTDLKSISAVVGRGGMLKPIEGGTYEVNEAMVEDLKIGVQGPHASNLGGILSNEIAKEIGKRAFIVDPVVVDEWK